MYIVQSIWHNSKLPDPDHEFIELEPYEQCPPSAKFKLDVGNCLLLNEDGTLFGMLECKLWWAVIVVLSSADDGLMWDEEETAFAACEVKLLSSASSGFCWMINVKD